MNNIGIAKLGKKVFFHDTSEDFASWSDEVVNTFHIFQDFGHKVHFLTESDLRDDEKEPLLDKYDRIYIFAGYDESHALETLKTQSDDIRLLVTDLRLVPNVDLRMFSKIYSQSPENHLNHSDMIFLPPTSMFYKYDRKNVEKDIKIYYGGGMRNKHKDFLEYVYRPNVKFNSKILLPGYFSDNRVGRNMHVYLLERTKYSIVIGDIEYCDIGYITLRHYENISANVISFMDSKFDKYETQMKKNDYRRVSSFEGMLSKIDELENDITKYNNIIKLQNEEIKPSYVTGEDCYSRLI